MPCLILRMPLRKTMLLWGGEGIELDWLDLVAIETVDDEDAVVSNIKQFFVLAVAPVNDEAHNAFNNNWMRFFSLEPDGAR